MIKNILLKMYRNSPNYVQDPHFVVILLGTVSSNLPTRSSRITSPELRESYNCTSVSEIIQKYVQIKHMNMQQTIMTKPNQSTATFLYISLYI